MPFGHSPERKLPQPAKKCYKFKLESGGEDDGVATIWPISKQEALVIAEYYDGDIRLYIEKDTGE